MSNNNMIRFTCGVYFVIERSGRAVHSSATHILNRPPEKNDNQVRSSRRSTTRNSRILGSRIKGSVAQLPSVRGGVVLLCRAKIHDAIVPSNGVYFAVKNAQGERSPSLQHRCDFSPLLAVVIVDFARADGGAMGVDAPYHIDIVPHRRDPTGTEIDESRKN